jgi:hypothetical protein
MKVLRAHDYDHVARVKRELSLVPAHWLDEVKNVSWIVYPDELSPLYTGLLGEVFGGDTKTFDGRWWSQVEAWCSFDPITIFTKPGVAEWAVLHEIGHALHDIWRVPLGHFFKPKKAFYEYMAANPEEYFAVAFAAFLHPQGQDEVWNSGHLAERDPDLFSYLKWRSNELPR